MGDAYCRTRNPLSQILHNPPMPLGLPELAFSGRRVFASGHSAGPYGLRCFAGSRMHKGLSVATLFAVRGSEYRGAVCYKAIRSAEFLDVEGLPAARSFADGSREPRGRGAICYKAFHAADWAATGAACFCKRLGRASGFRMALNRTGLQGSGDKRRCYRQGFRKMAFPYWVM